MLSNLTPRKVIFFSMALMLAVVLFGAAQQVPDLLAAKFGNPDSYYKLVLLRDYTPQGGLQYVARDNAPFGFYMHWSAVHSWVMLEFARGLEFLGLAKEPALLWAGGGLTLLSVLLLALCVVLTVTNQGGRLAALVAALVLVTSRPLQAYGQLLQLTHHIFMLVPLAAAACCFLRERMDLRPAIHTALDLAGGALLALALWTSPETMPLVVALAAIRAALRLQAPQLGPLWPAALGLLAALGMGWFLDPPPPTFPPWALDHISLAWLLFGAMLASLLLLTDLLERRSLPITATVAILSIVLVVEAIAWLTVVPGARNGVAGLIPAGIPSSWWSGINELRAATKPSEAVAWLFMPILGGALLLAVAWRERSLWRAMLALTTLTYAALAFDHVRSGATAAVVAALSYGIALLGFDGFGTHPPSVKAARRQWPAILLVLAPPLQMILWLSLVVLLAEEPSAKNAQNQGTSSGDTCAIATIAPRLNALPAGIVLGPINATPEILWRTHQNTVTGNYHHNAQGLIDYFHIWNSKAPDTQAQAILARRGVNYLLACEPPPTAKKGKDAPKSLMARLSRGLDVPWLPHHETIGDWHLYYR